MEAGGVEPGFRKVGAVEGDTQLAVLLLCQTTGYIIPFDSLRKSFLIEMQRVAFRLVY